MHKIEFCISNKDWLKLREIAMTAKDKKGKPIKPTPSVSFVVKDIILGILDGKND